MTSIFEKVKKKATEAAGAVSDAASAHAHKIADFAASVPDTIHTYAKNFSESDLWKKIGETATKAGCKVLEMVLTLYYSLGTASAKDKVLIAGALGYFILPADLIPDFLPGGFADDMAALTAVYSTVKDNISEDIQEKARDKVNEIAGKGASASAGEGEA